MFYDATLSPNPFRTDCYLLLIFLLSYENCKTEQSVFYRERELLIIESLCILRTLWVPP